MTRTTSSSQPTSGDESNDLSRDELLMQHDLDIDRIDNLEQALNNSRTIGAAIGIVMERRKVTQEEAFEMLADISQRRSRKLRDVATLIVDTGEIPED